MSKPAAKFKEEIAKLFPPTIFFFVALHLVAVLRSLMLTGTGISLLGSAQITVGALILGKAVLIADMFPFINRYPDKPLAFNIAWKTAIYVLIAMLIHYLERLIDFWREAGGLVAGNQKLLAENRMATLLGHPDLSAHIDPDVLHSTRSHPCSRGGRGAENVLRTALGGDELIN